MVMAQSANNSTIPFKEINQKQFADNFTARDIKKKGLEIAPSQIVRSAPNNYSSLYIPINFFDSR